MHRISAPCLRQNDGEPEASAQDRVTVMMHFLLVRHVVDEVPSAANLQHSPGRMMSDMPTEPHAGSESVSDGSVVAEQPAQVRQSETGTSGGISSVGVGKSIAASKRKGASILCWIGAGLVCEWRSKDR